MTLAAEGLNNKTYTVAGVCFAADLFWQPLPLKTGSNERSGLFSKAGSQSLNVAKDIKADIGVWRKSLSSPLQVGLGNQVDLPLKQGCYSSAAVIAHLLDQKHGAGAKNFIAVYKLSDDRFVFVAQKNGVITPTGDIVGDRDVVYKRLMQDLSIGGWELIISPEDWEVGGSESGLLEALLPVHSGKLNINELKTFILRPLVPNYKKLFFVVALVISATVIVYTSVGFYQKSDAPVVNFKSLIEQPQLPQIVDINTLKPSVLMNACMTAFKSADLWPGGWQLEEISCTNGRFNLAWLRGKSQIKWLLDTYPNSQISLDGNAASYGISFESIVAEKIAVDNLPVSEVAIQTLLQRAQSVGLVITLDKNEKVETNSLPGRSSKVEKSSQINWEMSLPMVSVMSLFDLPGNSIEQVVFSLKNGQIFMKIKGIQYVR